ncbi:MAG: cysteine hydrolase [Bacteroidetes bacterium]|nr:MAG: cysteine hydrolase [Bacteroidota bacterium]
MRFSVILLFLNLLPGPFLCLAGQKTGLLIVDIQEFYFPGGKLQLEGPETAGMNAGLILDQFRRRGLPVFHVRHNYQPGGEFHKYVKPLDGEAVISKDQVNPFLDTPLLELIKADSVNRLVICGMQTHMCVEAAVRAAHDLGIDCILVSDACATRALQYDEHIIPARNVHLSTLESLRGSYARITTTEDLLRDFDPFTR